MSIGQIAQGLQAGNKVHEETIPPAADAAKAAACRLAAESSESADLALKARQAIGALFLHLRNQVILGNGVATQAAVMSRAAKEAHGYYGLVQGGSVPLLDMNLEIHTEIAMLGDRARAGERMIAEERDAVLTALYAALDNVGQLGNSLAESAEQISDRSHVVVMQSEDYIAEITGTNP